MHKITIVCAALLFVSLLSLSEAVCPGQNAMLRPVGFETLAIPAEVVQLTVPRGAEFAVASLEGGSIRFRDDGASVPEETIGVRLADGTIFEICANSLDKARFTLEAGDDVFLQVSYYGR